jgi:hypothetical protein
MIEHIVLFKMKEGTRPEQIQTMMRDLNSLMTEIPEIVFLTCGANVSDRGGGFTHGLVARFESRQALDLYLAHPSHQQVVQETVLPITESLVVCDYPIE